MIFVRDIQAATAEHFGVPVTTMTTPDGLGTRVHEQTRSRQVAMCLSMRLTDHTFPRVGQFFGNRDHTTVLHAMRVIERKRAEPKIEEALRTLTWRLLMEDGR